MATLQTSWNISRPAEATPARKLTITVLAGGPGGEREISLQSGAAVAAALEVGGHAIRTEDVFPQRLSALAREVDCVFVALHGTFGEDGQIQRVLERRGLRYTGSPPEACALAMNKALAKERLMAAGLPTPRFTVARADSTREAIACWELPVIVKPVQEGSSLHCHIVRSFESFLPHVNSLIDRYGECLVEEYIPGLELTVGILGEQALPPIEIRTRREFYDYDAKYVDEDTEYLFEIDLPGERHPRRAHARRREPLPGDTRRGRAATRVDDLVRHELERAERRGGTGGGRQHGRGVVANERAQPRVDRRPCGGGRGR